MNVMEVGGRHQSRTPLLWISMLLLLLVLPALLLISAWVGDDAYITFRTIDNFLHGFGLTWNAGERVQSYTHPLWMLVMLPAYWLTGDVYYTSITLGIVLTVVAAGVLARRLAGSLLSACFVLLALMASKPFVDYSTSGLENAVLYLIIALFSLRFFRDESAPSDPFRLTFLGALAALTRLDALLILLPALVLSCGRWRGRRALLSAAVGFSPVLVWIAFSLFYYGSPFPNTAYAKLGAGVSRSDLVAQGIAYLQSAVMRSPFSMVTILGALFYALYERSGRLLALACGVLLYLAYVVLIGGDYMDGRFIAAPFFLAVVVLSRLPFRWASTESTVMAVTALTLGLAWPYSPVRSGRDYGTGPEVNYYWKGISDERAGWYPKSGLLAPDKKVKPIDHRWVEEGLAAAQGTKTVIERAGIGLFGFFAGPRVYAVDVHALGDPLLARLPTHTPRKWRIGHFRRNIPDGYMATVETGRNVIEDSSLARYYDILSVITRGELLSIGRLKEVWRFNAGSYDHLMRDYLSHPLTVAYEKFSSPRARGTPYLSPGNKIPSVSGLRVDLDSVVHLPHAEISIDSNDDYVLEYRLGTKVSGRNIIGTQRIQEGGLRVDTLTIPPEAVSCGYDNVLILPRGGDETYSVGHLRLF